MDKTALRREVLGRRAALGDRGSRSEAILARVRALDAYRSTRLVASYVGVGDEVETTPLLREAFDRKVAVAVPWRDGARLHLVRIVALSELVPVSFGLLEPPPELAKLAGRVVVPSRVDLMLVPGLAFDRRGGRLGHGRGFYDRLLAEAGTGPLRVGLAFDCQIVERVPMTAGDQPMDLVVTENAVYRVSARTASADR
jgi:5-formyltetrahydrofolate cyclo-ligase